MKFINLQFAFFFKNYLLEQPDKLSVTLREVSSIFDGTPLVIPLPKDAPDNIPILQLSSEDNTYQLSVAKGRADFFYNAKAEDQEKDFSDHSSNFSEQIKTLFQKLSSLIEIKRIGYITTFFEENKDASKTIQETFFKKDLGTLKELNIRFNKGKETEKFELNDITKIDPGQLLLGNVNGILISRDINTVAEKEYKFDISLLNEFLIETEKSFSFSQIKSIFE